MKKKLVAQCCCVALVAAGIGLNVQNAIADYGMNGDVISLVASGETGSLPCTTVAYNLVATCTHSNAQPIDRIIQQCGDRAGAWKLIGCLISNGDEIFHEFTQQTHQEYVTKSEVAYVEDQGDKKIYHYHTWFICTEYTGEGGSNCDKKGDIVDMGVS